MTTRGSKKKKGPSGRPIVIALLLAVVIVAGVVIVIPHLSAGRGGPDAAEFDEAREREAEMLEEMGDAPPEPELERPERSGRVGEPQRAP